MFQKLVKFGAVLEVPKNLVSKSSAVPEKLQMGAQSGFLAMLLSSYAAF